jgi:SWI/SNF-related matrix-associated actin-dependent regulator of chromatin subfamily A member 5
LSSGKTLQTISYISYLTTELKIPGPHLIVVPLSVLFNWILEFRSFCPSLRIFRMHSNNPQDQQRLREILTTLSRHSEDDNGSTISSSSSATAACPYDVIITTYEMVKGKLETNLARVYWRTMVLDEGHRIKNDEALITKACLHYKARFKIVLTGGSPPSPPLPPPHPVR